MLSVVLLYANIRGNNIGQKQNSSLLLRILDEFSAYDMLICSKHYESNVGKFNYNGINYLSFPFIPKII